MDTLRLAARVRCTNAEGPFRRYALWVQGCTLRCPGCCNPEMFNDAGGEVVPVASILQEILRARRDEGIEGCTILGGEPLQQTSAVTELATGARRADLGVIVFTGYRLQQARRHPGFARLWQALDTLVDGPFDPSRPEPPGGRRFLGSTNQRLVHRTNRYAAPAQWAGDNHVEARIAPDGTVSVHGWPADSQRMVRALRQRVR